MSKDKKEPYIICFDPYDADSLNVMLCELVNCYIQDPDIACERIRILKEVLEFHRHV